MSPGAPLSPDLACPFCAVPETEVRLANQHAIAFFDRYPLAEGHTLVVPRRHLASIFDATVMERTALWNLVDQARTELADRLRPNGFNIGVNDGAAAGQTVGHGHIHVIPRREGDVEDPRGGVRWVLPEKAAYWKSR